MMVGLQGSGKTTTTAKIAKRLTEREKQEGADGVARRRARPRRSSSPCSAADGVDTLPIVAGQTPVQIARAPSRPAAAAAMTWCCSTPPAAPYRRALMVEMAEIKPPPRARTKSCSSPTR
jgi:signal recognition particle subunit SRP54